MPAAAAPPAHHVPPVPAVRTAETPGWTAETDAWAAEHCAGAREPVAVPVPEPVLVLLGGVPGAGKSTVLRAVAQLCPEVQLLDPEQQQRRLAPYLQGLPYRLWRPLVHALHQAAVLRVLLTGRGVRRAGPARPLLVHDTATRAWVRAAAGRLARAGGRRGVLLLLDVTERDARAGQVQRARVVRRRSFDRHWRRWTLLRGRLAGGPLAEGGWTRVQLVSRDDALREILSALGARC